MIRNVCAYTDTCNWSVTLVPCSNSAQVHSHVKEPIDIHKIWPPGQAPSLASMMWLMANSHLQPHGACSSPQSVLPHTHMYIYVYITLIS